MDNPYCFNIEFTEGNIESSQQIKDSLPVASVHHAHLYDSPEKIDIRIYFAHETYFHRKFDAWLNNINFRKLGQYIKTSNVAQNHGMQSLSFEQASFKGYSTSSANIEGQFEYIVVSVDWVRIEWKANEWEINTAKFYLNQAGFKVVSFFYSPLWISDNKFESQRRSEKYFKINAQEYRPEFNFYQSDDSKKTEIKITKEPLLSFKEVQTEESVLGSVNMLCSSVSFFYQNNIDYSFARIQLPEKTITIRKLLPPQIDYPANNLWHLKNHWSLEKYLESDWSIGFMKNQGKLFKAIRNYVQAFQVDESSRYLLLYNILEIIKGGKSDEPEKFKLIVNEQEESEKYLEALATLLKTVNQEEHEAFKDKWNGIIGKLKYKPIKSPISELLIDNDIVPDDLPVTINRLAEIRNKLVHGSIYGIQQDELEKATRLIYRITGILILNLMGIKEWKLDTLIVV